MNLSELDIPKELFEVLNNEGIKKLNPGQAKAIKAGLLEGKNILTCIPTASGKTLIAELACMKSILERKGKAIFIVPLKALATEKYKEFKRKYEKFCKVGISIGEKEGPDYLDQYDFIICTSEKLDALLRHHAPWIKYVATIVVDEIHLLNDPGRGPTLEIILTMLRKMLDAQIIGLSATIGNPEELAEWLEAELVKDDWRPCELKKGIYYDGKIEF